MLEKLTLTNMDVFKEIYYKNFKKISYNKDFFTCYEEQNFLLKFIYRKFVRLIKVKDTYIGYIWYESVYERVVKVWALYIDVNYKELIDETTLSYFDKSILYYEEIDSKENTLLLSKLGFTKENYTLLLKMNITKNYNKESYIKTDYKFNHISNYENNITTDEMISIRKLYIGLDERTRCNIQNDIFEELDRKALTIEDIYADMSQDYFLKDLCFFGILNNEYIGYGQIIFNRNMYTVVNFGIVKKYRGHGLSKIFLNKIIIEAKNYGIEDLYIRVDSNNIKAINLYKGIGFEDINKVIVWKRTY